MSNSRKTIALPSLVVFSAVMIVVFISFGMSRNSVKEQTESYGATYAQQTEDSVRDRLDIFGETLRAGAGLVVTHNDLTKEEWKQFIQTSAVLQRYPGSSGIGYAKVVHADELPTFLGYARNAVKPDFTITPAGTRDTYVPIIFAETQNGVASRAIGADIYSDPVRRKALVSSRDSGEVTVTDAVQSVMAPGSSSNSFVMYAPQYKAGMPTRTDKERQKAIAGYVYAGFQAGMLMQDIAGDQEEQDVGLKMFIGENKAELFKTENYDTIRNVPHATRTSTMMVGGTPIIFEYVYEPSKVLASREYTRPWAIVIFGLITAILISMAVWLLLRGKANQLLLEQERDINEAKDNLLSLASHQLRTPATGVKQYLGLLLQGYAGDIAPQQRKLIEKAYEGNERQLKTINDVLYLARLGSGRIVLSKSSFSVSRMIEDMIRELRSDIKAKNHKVVFKAPKSQKQFYGDEHMIRMAIENLLTNALKYTHAKGKVTIKVKYGKDLKVSVEDNGVGIPENQQERMFKQFERIENDLSITVGGTGIGLFVVQHVADLHEGYIEVESKVDHGSRFTLVMPFLKSSQNNKNVK